MGDVTNCFFGDLIACWKTSIVHFVIKAKPTNLHNTALVISIPNTINGAHIVVKSHSQTLQQMEYIPKLIRLSTHGTFSNLTATIDLAITPSKAGAYRL